MPDESTQLAVEACGMVAAMQRGCRIQGSPWNLGDTEQAAKFYRWAFDPSDPMYSPDDIEWQRSAVRCIRRRFHGQD